MGTYPNIYLLITVLLAVIYYLRWEDTSYKKFTLTLASAIFVLSLSLFVFVTAILAAGFVTFVGKHVDRSRPLLYRVCIAICLLPVFINDFGGPRLFEFLGGGFLGIRTFLLFKFMTTGSSRFSFTSSLLYLLFFPIYLAGPIERPDELEQKIISARPDAGMMGFGVIRFMTGLVKIYLLASLASSFSQSLDIGSNFEFATVWLFCIVNWLALYFLFSGYADTAIGTAQVFGIPIKENFNFPFLARTIQEYWQRWHITLMEIVSENVYRTFVRKTGRRATGFFVSFFAMGMWHEISLNYLLWGLIHASIFAVYFLYSRSRLVKKFWHPTLSNHSLLRNIWAVASIILTISCVSLASTIGTTELIDVIEEKLR